MADRVVTGYEESISSRSQPFLLRQFDFGGTADAEDVS